MALHAEFAAGNTDQNLVLDHQRSGRPGRALAGIAVLRGPGDLAGLGVERDKVGVGLMQEDHAVAIGHAAVDGIAAHHRDDVRILLRFVFPEDLVLVVEIERIDLVRERGVDVHHVSDDQRSAFVAAQHAGRKRPCDLQLADIGRGDLIEFRIARVGVVARRHDPALRVLRHLIQRVIGIGGACDECRHSAKTGCE